MTRALLMAGLMQLCLLGCGNDHGFGPGSGLGPGDDEVDAGAGESSPAPLDGLPCDVQSFLAARCQSCHSSKPSGGAPMSLMSYRDLTARNRDGAMIADRVLARITDAASPMPPMPAPAVSSTDIAMFRSWVSRGVPSSGCGAQPEPPPPGPQAPGPFDGPTVCTSGHTWTGGDQASPLMHPGRACVACHTSRHDDANDHGDDAPRFTIAGTVYPTGHEPDDCNGATAASVEITDSSQKVTTLPINAAGNFFTTSAIAFPIHVAVVVGGKRRAMSALPPSGDCNSCHTEDGANHAPGRIALP